MSENEASEAVEEAAGDVYLVQPQPLQEGEEKNIISVFVADEAGLINRVAGVFARRGANIESLAVALNEDKALFTIVVNGTKSAVNNLCKQMNKLVKVREVNNISKFQKIDRELMLIKVRANPGPQRTEVLQIAEVFRANVSDLGNDSIILAAVGDPGKLFALQQLLSNYGILEVARTGRIALLRGQEGVMGLHRGDSDLSGSKGVTSTSSVDEDFKSEVGEGDVYAIGTSVGDFLTGTETIMDITIDEAIEEDVENGVMPHLVSIVVSNSPGVLNRVTGVFARRGYNIISLAVGPSVNQGISRITMVVPGTNSSISKLTKQLYKIVDVMEVTDLTGMPHVARELCLIKVCCSPEQRRDLETTANIFHGSIVDVSATTLVIQVQGKERKLKALQDVLEPYGILEIARTGRVALQRSSGVDTTYLQRFQQGRLL